MPEDSSKNQPKKGRHDAKEQRKPRQSRHQNHSTTASEKKVEKNIPAPKVTAPEKPVYVDPGPEFYKNLKRETDEIIKITEEATSKYKKKEIQSNWAKYEIPIDSYEEIEEQENMGADYEKLIEAPLSIGGHFQFKHEKSWDIDTAPSLYDRFFEVDMDNLSLAIQTIPFHERNGIDKLIFNETDILNMSNRSTRFKQKYFKDKSITTPELEAQDKILNSLKENLNKSETNTENNKERDDSNEAENMSTTHTKDIDLTIIEDKNECRPQEQDKNSKNKATESKIMNEKIQNKVSEPGQQICQKSNDVPSMEMKFSKTDSFNTIKIEGIQGKNKTEPGSKAAVSCEKFETVNDVDDIILEDCETKVNKAIAEKPITKSVKVENKTVEKPAKDVTPINEPRSNPVIESPEDLEKWLDDFLDS